MDQARLAALLVARGDVERLACVQLSATKFVPAEQWAGLKRHEQEFLRCYAAGVSAHKAVLVGRSAARALGLWVLGKDPEVIGLAQRNGHPPSKTQWPEGVVYRNIPIPEMDIREHTAFDPAGAGGRIRLTTPARTAIDIARFHGVRDAVVAMDSLYREQTPIGQETTRAALASTMGRLAGKKGVGLARRAFELSSTVSESAFESLFRVILLEHGIQAKEQMWVGRRYRVDLLWGNLIIEIDGYIKFDDMPHAEVIRMTTRDNWLKEQGYEVLHLFPAEILRDEAGCIRRVFDAKARADARGPVTVPATPYRP
ncbi:endonuclease domain-containing protein [Corynebacterium mucifaciens]|uniref:Very-short-patch-repair endonuclease n=1 Tax=Corynebacterium mucifaciens TaxID=57171 RepID=A0A7X6LRU8_9CORY|nr:hypothetical protein [Corynebacterium mucifaciens]NKY69158.1 hypothetical protein [Corynebacterium mucifaciens]